MVHKHKTIPIKKFQNNVYASLSLGGGGGSMTVTSRGKPSFHVIKAADLANSTLTLTADEEGNIVEEKKHDHS